MSLKPHVLRARGFSSFVAIFGGPQITDEGDFERLLWSQLGQLHDADRETWSEQVSPDPDDKHFAYSLAGTPFVIVGLRPMTSRDARRARTSTLVCNLHEQLRRCGLRTVSPDEGPGRVINSPRHRLRGRWGGYIHRVRENLHLSGRLK